MKILTATEITYFSYDGDGGRVQKIYSRGSQYTATTYVGSLFEIIDSSLEPDNTKKHIFLGDTRVVTIETSTEHPAPSTYYFHGDHLGSSNLITNESGEVVQLSEYTPYGTLARSEGDVTNYKFTGKELDDSTGLYFYGARYYDPEIGRFITPDTIIQSPSDPQSLNRYAYARNNPVNLIDPTGHSWKSFWKKFGSWFGLVGSLINAINTGDWAQFGMHAAIAAATIFAAAFASWAIAPLIKGMSTSFAASGAGVNFFEGFLIGGIEIGVPAFAGSFAGNLASGQSFGDAFRGAAISGGIAFVGAGLIEGSYSAGWQDSMHFTDTRAVEQTHLNKLVKSGKLQQAVDYAKALQGKYVNTSNIKLGSYLDRHGFKNETGTWTKTTGEENYTMKFGEKAGMKLAGDSTTELIPYGAENYLTASTKQMTLTYGEYDIQTKIFSFNYGNDTMQLNALSLGMKDSIKVGTAQAFLGVNIYNSFKVDLDKY